MKQCVHSSISPCISRRTFFQYAGIFAASGLLLCACAPKEPETVVSAIGTPIACYGEPYGWLWGNKNFDSIG